MRLFSWGMGESKNIHIYLQKKKKSHPPLRPQLPMLEILALKF